MVRMRRTHDDQPALITTAPRGADDEYDKRRKKYAIMMATRALCVILAAVAYEISLYLALVFVVAGVVLPWCAVLIANDRPPKRRQVELGHIAIPTERALPSGTVDG
jgi:Flp pilus assembly protein TadB